MCHFQLECTVPLSMTVPGLVTVQCCSTCKRGSNSRVRDARIVLHALCVQTRVCEIHVDVDITARLNLPAQDCCAAGSLYALIVIATSMNDDLFLTTTALPTCYNALGHCDVGVSHATMYCIAWISRVL